ncbi:unnamed protein product [Ranitomeya imitator]|uniref:Chromo domain-containing protein n=1 Tax=Ranitomeya imitator TaxID=111125 RepID=A0ABN9KSA6_9NEOB|nr:unnamed protein product [Ranitomeya imitator]
MDPVKVQAIHDWIQPTSVKGLQKFLGFANFYRRFIAKFSSVVKPLTYLTKKGADVTNWSSEAVEAFQELKRRFTSAPVLRQPDVSLPFQEFQADRPDRCPVGKLFVPDGWTRQVEPSDCPGVDSVVDRLQKIWTHVVDNLTLSQERAQRFANRRRCVGPRLRVGDLVWLSSRHVPMKVSSPKFKPRFIGPYNISEIIYPVSFRLALPASFAIHNVFHRSLLRRYVVPVVPSVDPPAPVLVEGELEYEVEKILDSRFSRRRLQYLVKWKGYGQEDNSWVVASDVHATDLVRAFHLARPDRPGGSAIRFGRMPEAERRRLVQPSTEDTDSPVSDLVALSQRIHSSYMSTFTMTKKRARDILTGKSSISPFVIYDMETLWEAEKGTVWDQLPTQNPPGTEIGVHVFYRCQCTSVETVRALTDFAKSIPGFSTLYLNDQVTLLKYGVHEAIFCMLASLMNKDGLLVAGGHGFVTREFLRSLRLPFCHIMEPKFNFASKFNALELNDSDLALFVAAIILCGG